MLVLHGARQCPRRQILSINQSRRWWLELIRNHHPVSYQKKSDQVCICKNREWCVRSGTDLAGRDQGRRIFFASLLRYSFTSCSAVPNTPNNKSAQDMKWTETVPIPFLVAQKTRIGFPTEYCWRVGNNLESRDLANWKSFRPFFLGTPTMCRVNLHGR